MREIPHTMIKQYNNQEEPLQHRIPLEPNLSPLKATLEMYRVLPRPYVIHYPDDHYEFNTQRRWIIWKQDQIGT